MVPFPDRYSPIGYEIWYEENDDRKMYGLLHAGVQFDVAREEVPARVRVDEDHLRVVHDVAETVRKRRRDDAHQHVDAILLDQLLRFLQAGRGHVGVVLVDQVDRTVGQLLVVLKEVQLRGASHRVPELRVDAGERKELADLHPRSGRRRRGCAGAGRGARRTRGESRRGACDQELAPRQPVGVPTFRGKLVLDESAHCTPPRFGQTGLSMAAHGKWVPLARPVEQPKSVKIAF